MRPINSFLDRCKRIVQRFMNALARSLNSLSGGKISPNMITLIGLTAHLPIAWLIATQHNIWAAGLLVIFGLFDALDGALARLQKVDSNVGMVLDASTDKFKEVFLYCGAAYAIIASTGRPYLSVWAVAACGASLCVSYVKAKGETAIKDSNLSANQINRIFGDGLMRFEVRMFVLVAGLLSNNITIAVIVIAVLAGFTAVDRLINITRKLSDV